MFEKTLLTQVPVFQYTIDKVCKGGKGVAFIMFYHVICLTRL